MKPQVQHVTRQLGIFAFLFCLLTRHEWVPLETLKWCRTCDYIRTKKC